VNVPALKLAHVDAMIARGRFVPMRKRPDTRPINVDVLWAEPCEQCGADVDTKGWHRHTRVLCDPCRLVLAQTEAAAPRKFQNRQRSAAEVKAAYRRALRMLAGQWFTARMLAEMASSDPGTAAKVIAPMLRRGKVEERLVSKKTGREWRVVA